MADLNCSCGAALPAEAKFCPLCGRPATKTARQEAKRKARLEVEASRERLRPASERDDPEQEGAGAPSFGDPSSLRAAYPGAAIAALLSHMQFVSSFCFLWYPAAGFLTVYIYRRATNTNPRSLLGAKLGWITGVMTFTISLVLGLIVSAFSSQRLNYRDQIIEQIQQSGAEQEAIEQVLRMVESPIALALLVLAGLVLSFMITTGFSTLGGAIGGKVLDDD